MEESRRYDERRGRTMADLLGDPEWRWAPRRARMLSGIYLLERIVGIGIWVVVVGGLVLAAVSEYNKESSAVRAISPTPIAQPKPEEAPAEKAPAAEPRKHGVFESHTFSIWSAEDDWTMRFVKRLERAWTPPPRPVGLGDLKTAVTVEFWGTGAVKRITMHESGRESFDQSVEEAVRRSLPAPRLPWLASKKTATKEFNFYEEDTPVTWPEG